jgi:hypothetical protein
MTVTQFEPKQLLLSNRLTNLSHDPFCFFSVDDYLPEDLYRTLVTDIPEGVDYATNAEGKLGFRSNVDSEAFDRFRAEHPAWGKLFDFFDSDAFVHDAQRTLAEPLRRARGWAGRRPWYNCSKRRVPRNWLRYRLQEPMRTTIEFGQLPRDGVVAPHTDAPRKLVTLVLYLREPDWQDAWGGGTEYYAPLDPERAATWAATARIPFEEFKSIGATPYVANRLAGFVRASNSYHGVLPVTCPPGYTRKALMINMKRVKWSKRERL